MPTDAIAGNKFGIGSVGVLQGIHLGGPTSLQPTHPFKPLQVGVIRNDSEGYPTAPSLEVHFLGSWRFRWYVKAGARTFSVFAKQIVNLDPRPAAIIKANTGIGLLADTVMVAPSGTDWVRITGSITPTADGVVWVELHNRLLSQNCPAYFDSISTT